MHELNSAGKTGKSTCERKQKKADPCSKSSIYLPGQGSPCYGDLGPFYFPLILVRSVFPTVQQVTRQRKNIFLFHHHFFYLSTLFIISCCCLQNRSQNEVLPCSHLEQASISFSPLHIRFFQMLLKWECVGLHFHFCRRGE